MPRHSVQMLAAAVAAVLLLADAPAHATAISKNFNATASVAAKCVMSNVGDLNFGAYDPVVANATTGLAGNTSFTLTCTRGSAPIISLSVANANFGQNIAGKRAKLGRCDYACRPPQAFTMQQCAHALHPPAPGELRDHDGDECDHRAKRNEKIE